MQTKKTALAMLRVIGTNVRLFCGKILHGSKLAYSPLTCLAFSDSVSLSNSASINFGKRLRTRGGCSFNVQESGRLVLGKDVFLNRGCLFNCHSSILVGDGCEFGPNVTIYDHDHVFRGGCLKMASSSTALLRLAKIAGLVPEPSSCVAQSLVTIALSAQGVLSKENSLPVHWYFRNARPTFEWRDGGMAVKSQHGTILYVGGFALPDGNAAAQRVVANVRLFAKIGYKIAFLNYSKEVITPRKTEYFGFECFECPDAEWRIASRLDIDRIKEIVSERSDIKYVIAYNYPAPSLSRLIKLCRERGIKCFGDVTEWYRARDVSLVKMPLKYIDTVIRMKWLHPKMDGLIVISEYLRSYYGGCVPTLLLPPMVDADDDKWRPIDESEFGVVKFVYAGKPSKTKERLDLIVDAVVSLPVDFKVRLDIVGVTAEEFSKVYGHSVSSRRVVFHGRVPHEDAVGFVKQADYSVIVRDDNLVTRAGFPSKFAESISCGTPVICNDNSDLKIWVEKYGCGFVVEKDSLTAEFACILKQPKPSFDVRIFDYRNFRPQAADFFNSIDGNKEN